MKITLLNQNSYITKLPFLLLIYFPFINLPPSYPYSPPFPHPTMCTPDFSGNIWKLYPSQTIQYFLKVLVSTNLDICFVEQKLTGKSETQMPHGPPGVISHGLTVLNFLHNDGSR